MEGQDRVAGILWDTHDGREAQSRLTEPESDAAREMERVAERQNSRTAESGRENRESGRAPLTDQIRRHAPGCRLRAVVGLVASCYIDPNGHVGCGGGVDELRFFARRREEVGARGQAGQETTVAVRRARWCAGVQVLVRAAPT